MPTFTQVAVGEPGFETRHRDPHRQALTRRGWDSRSPTMWLCSLGPCQPPGPACRVGCFYQLPLSTPSAVRNQLKRVWGGNPHIRPLGGAPKLTFQFRAQPVRPTVPTRHLLQVRQNPESETARGRKAGVACKSIDVGWRGRGQRGGLKCPSHETQSWEVALG